MLRCVCCRISCPWWCRLVTACWSVAASGLSLGGGRRPVGVSCAIQASADYAEKVEAMRGKAVTGDKYNMATHIVVEGIILPGVRALWEGDGKVVTTTRWIHSCFNDWSLLPIPVKDESESILPTINMTPLVRKESTGTKRCCASDGKMSMHRHGSSRPRSSRRKLEFTPSGLYHNLLCCREDNRSSELLYDYALTTRTYDNSSLPGYKRSFKLSKVSTKLILGTSYNQMASLHVQGKSLGGLFSSKQFRIYSDGMVLIDVSESQLVPYSDNEGDKDYTSFVKMVKHEVFHNLGIPLDLVEWLNIISKGVAECHPIVLSNFIHLKEPFQAFGAFVTMYLQFDSIQNTAGWGRLYNSLAKYDDWPLKYCRLMQQTFGHTDHDGYLSEYEPDIRGLLRLIWNCSKHRAKREVKFFINMVLVDYPTLLSDLQVSLFEGGYLCHLKLKSQQ